MSWPVPSTATPAERLDLLDRDVIAPALMDLGGRRLAWMEPAVASVLRRADGTLRGLCDAVCDLTRPLYRREPGDMHATVTETMARGDDCEGLSAAAVVILAGVARRAAWAATVRGVPVWLVRPGAASDHVALAVCSQWSTAPTLPSRVLGPGDDLPAGWWWCDPAFPVPFGEHPARWAAAQRKAVA